MDVAYCKVSDCVDVIPSLADIQNESARLEAVLSQSILDASRLIETRLIVPVNYFKQASEDFSVKTFYSNGTSYLRLVPYTSIEYVYDSDDAVIDEDSYMFNDYNPYDPRTFYLKWRYGSCARGRWLYDKVKISATWGFPCVPPDIVLAVKSMACLMFLANPQASYGLEGTLDDNQEQRLRLSYSNVVDSWLEKFHHQRCLGVGN